MRPFLSRTKEEERHHARLPQLSPKGDREAPKASGRPFAHPPHFLSVSPGTVRAPMSEPMCGCGCSIISTLMKRLGRSTCCSDLLSCSHTSEHLQRLATRCPPPTKVTPAPQSSRAKPEDPLALVTLTLLEIDW